MSPCGPTSATLAGDDGADPQVAADAMSERQDAQIRYPGYELLLPKIVRTENVADADEIFLPFVN
jgi:hypothetical protein